MKTREILAQIATAGITFAGIIVSVVSIAEGDPEIMFGVGLPMIGAGSFTFRKLRKGAFRRVRRDQEQELMRLFVHTGERYSLAEVAMTLNITIDETRDLMDELHAKGIFEIETTETGAIVYSIPTSNRYTIEPRNYENGDYENGSW